MTTERVPYADIPQTMRDLLDDVLIDPLDVFDSSRTVEIWWNARTTHLGGAAPREMWTVPEGRRQVQQVVEMLADGSLS